MSVATFLLHHRHQPRECGVAYASFKGHPSPLRRSDAVSSCLPDDVRDEARRLRPRPTADEVS